MESVRLIRPPLAKLGSLHRITPQLPALWLTRNLGVHPEAHHESSKWIDQLSCKTVTLEHSTH
jgi:hypothetical protein